MSNTLARVRIKDFANTALSAAQDDFLGLDGETNGTRRISAEGFLKPLRLRVEALEGVGGNLNAYDFGTGTPTQEQLTVYAIGQIWPGYTDLSYNADNPAQSAFNDAEGNPHTAAEIFNATRVKNLSDESIFMLTNTQDTEPKVFDWANVGKESVENLKQLGEIYFSLSNLEKYNPGAILVNAPKTLTKVAANYSNLLQFVQENPSLNKSASEWQSYYEEYEQCPYFSLTEDDSGDYNLKLPVIKEYIKAVNPDDGTPSIKATEAGLPNITGTVLTLDGQGGSEMTGAFYDTGRKINSNAHSDQADPVAGFDASRSNAAYGNSTTVTPAHITLYPWLYVFYNNTNPANEPIPYELLPATADRLGGIKVGSGLNIAEDGTLSTVGGGASSDTALVDLGEVTSATFEVNKNYTATLIGTAVFNLQTPSNTSVANKIILNLNVLSQSTVDWDANVNAALSYLSPGKYEIRLLWNNISSAWTAEVLKEIEASSPVKLLIRFNGSIVDESSSPITLTPSRTVTEFPVYDEGEYGNQKLTCTSDSKDNYVIASGNNLSKLNLGNGDFTIRCWLTLSSTYVHPVSIFYKNDNNKISIGYDRIQIRLNGNLILNQSISGISAGGTAYITLTRQNGILYVFVNGNLIVSQASAEDWNFSDWVQIFKGSGVVGNGHYGIQELIVKNTCDYISNFTPPIAPFVLADNSVADLHDIEKEDISNKTSDYTLNGENTYPSSKALSEAVSYLEGLISAAAQPMPDYSNAVEFSKAANVSYTCPSAGWIQIRAATFTASAGAAGYAKISIDGNDIRSYYVSNSGSTTYNWSNNSGSNFSGETLIQVAQGDNVKFYADGFTMSNATFEGTFVPQAA